MNTFHIKLIITTNHNILTVKIPRGIFYCTDVAFSIAQLEFSAVYHLSMFLRCGEKHQKCGGVN